MIVHLLPLSLPLLLNRIQPPLPNHLEQSPVTLVARHQEVAALGEGEAVGRRHAISSWRLLACFIIYQVVLSGSGVLRVELARARDLLLII